MISFVNDYSEGMHPKIIERLVETNMQQEPGYGFDSFTESAKEKIRQEIDCPDAQITFLVGGTQTNQTVIDAVLNKYEGVIAADTGHIAVHEAGAIEKTGHKVLTIPHQNGKLVASDVKKYIERFYEDENEEHMVYPGMVYISYPTEYGTLYSKQEMKALADVCHEYEIPLFVDGARLGYGLVSKEADMTMADLAKICDVFYIGATKIGALFGEAVVFTKNNEPKHFMTQVKQHGALLAKGRFLGLMFDTLFTDGLYYEISRHAVEMSQRIKAGFEEKGYQLLMHSPTNQQFVVMSDEQAAKLAQKVKFATWERYDDEKMSYRFVTCWATLEENVDYLLSII
ncbi:Beta-eliminating lyase [Ligilactobacillus hayakitensis DSM 18933 = JCM 14209]|uniref:Beta-eliminating lyase n=1 Tax=Ligilactobacillus hayakitensis DSM 18933 = JCM 14209 TaxID=1423755 RepID=A0A0R1WSI5_9LACO|nr:aminotransferase class V-fold PLP-dependent enzyme [Ligilactobacillus hayakitensis]KRM19140.1 Beta-eliminating lyase [Ligilactobacillus hayakitensis DSM 18933 = JCM 14209]